MPDITAANPDIATPELMKSISAAFNSRDVDRIVACFTDDATFWLARGPEPVGRTLKGKETIRKTLADRFKVIPDMRWDHKEYIFAGNRAISVWTVKGKGADGEDLNYQGCDIYTFRGGKISRQGHLLEDRRTEGSPLMALDLVIRGGTVVDGSGKAALHRRCRHRGRQASSRSAASQSVAARTIDADGLIVSPGFIDGHTHMDAQVAWDPLGSCSCWHGVTSVVMSNCGFALAPCKPEDRDWYARCLSAVEDIPTEAMAAGIDWTWETFPEYLATVERLPKAINYGMYIGHSALRMYVMGKRALSEKATEDDMTRMAAAVKEALRRARMGFSSSRASTHVTPDDTPVASRIAEWEEIDRIIAAMAELDAGIFQVGPDIASGAAHRTFLDAPARGRARLQAADHVRRAGDQAGRRSDAAGATRPSTSTTRSPPAAACSARARRVRSTRSSR